MGTGDRNEECYVGVSHDGAATFQVDCSRDPEVPNVRIRLLSRTSSCGGWMLITSPIHLIRLQRESATIDSHGELPGVTFYHRKLDENRALLGLAQQVAELWVASARRRCVSMAQLVSSSSTADGPAPGVRLAAADRRAVTDGFVHVNPIRTVEHEAAIFRIPKSGVPHPQPAA